MAKRKEKETEDQDKAEAVESDASMSESTSGGDEASVSMHKTPDEAQSRIAVEESATDDVSPDDLLEDVRRSLIEDEEKKTEEQSSKWWKRIGKGSRKQKPAEVMPVARAEHPVETPAVEPPVQKAASDEYGEQIDELIDLLEAETGEDTSKDVVVHDPVVEPPVEEVVDLEEMKRRAFRTSKPEDIEENFSEVRSVALEGGEEVFVEVEIKKEDPFEERVKAFENALAPYRRYINFAAAFIALVVIVVTSGLLYQTYSRSHQPAVAEPTAVLPYPVAMNLPGGLSFNLGKGAVQNGKWNPRNAEWLEGTEICRWVAIPYSRQLEAVVRTFTREDQIQLIMSNSDKLVYNVYSIQQLSMDEMKKLDSGAQCLLLVLAEGNADKRWVVLAVP